MVSALEKATLREDMERQRNRNSATTIKCAAGIVVLTLLGAFNPAFETAHPIPAEVAAPGASTGAVDRS